MQIPRTAFLVAEICREAMRGLMRQRWRTLLSMLGISWGVIAVVVLLAYGDGLASAIDRGFKGAFGDGVTLMMGGQTSRQAGGERSGRSVKLRLADAEAVGELPLVRAWSPEYWRDLPVAWRTKQSGTLVRAIAPAYAGMRSQPVAAGRMIDAEDVRLQRRVAFLGSEVARKLFGNVPPVGETIRIQGMRFDVIGVQREKVQLANYQRPDKECVFIPFSTAGHLWDTTYLNALVYQAPDASVEEKATRQVKELLAGRLRFDPRDERALRTFGSAQTASITGGIVLALNLVLSVIAVLTLTVGGVGVMNIMFMSVTERTREIGLRKALGARRRSILLQFLLEGVVTAIVGGAVGIAASALLVWVISPMPFLSEMLDDPTGTADIYLRLSVPLVALSTAMLGVVGVASALAPAVRAARMDPIEALRHE